MIKGLMAFTENNAAYGGHVKKAVLKQDDIEIEYRYRAGQATYEGVLSAKPVGGGRFSGTWREEEASGRTRTSGSASMTQILHGNRCILSGTWGTNGGPEQERLTIDLEVVFFLA